MPPYRNTGLPPTVCAVRESGWIIVPWGFVVPMPACHRYSVEGVLVHQGEVVLEEDSCQRQD